MVPTPRGRRAEFDQVGTETQVDAGGADALGERVGHLGVERAERMRAVVDEGHVEVARDQAKEAGHSLMTELRLLTTHGLLHLLGFDHADPHDRDEMFTLQDRLLAGFEQRDRATPGRTP